MLGANHEQIWHESEEKICHQGLFIFIETSQNPW